MRYLFFALALVMLAPDVGAQSYTKGMRAFESRNFAAAIREWRPLADQGKARAQFRLGQMYHYGLGVPQDYVEAVNWYRKAAEQGYANGQSYLGYMYNNGLGVDRDNVEGHKWFNLAAAQGHPGAVRNRARVASIMTRKEILAAQTRAREWMESRKQ